ncbi:MAG TPA: hypothetical protein VJ984_16180, partial [Xanthomonadales bacterium]|nr:hypothetical protein [Xanthomonadales bacterium]
MSSLFSELKRRNVVRVSVAYAIVAWLIVQVADIMQPALLLPDWFTRVVTILVMLGFPLAVFFSWAYELTPEGIKTTAEVDAEESVTPQTGRKLDRIIIGMLVLVVGVLLADRFLLSPEPVSPAATAEVAVEPGVTSIAVMPFVNMSSEAEQDYFSDGISEEILNVLAGVEGLQVTSRSSSFALRDDNLDIPTIAEKLGVNHVLEGSVRKAGNRVRVTAQLIQVDQDAHLWSDTYDRDLNDIFAIQDEISGAIVDALKEELGLSQGIDVIDSRLHTNPDAYAAYLRGNHLLNQRTRRALETAVTEYRSALVLDPEFARAHAQLAINLLLLREEQ